jgi:predicted RNase H-like nuclease (RuvC/YqgF family)
VDIASGSPSSKQAPHYALFVLNGEREERHPMISRHKLIRLIRQMEPEMVAVDNVHELASGRTDLVKLLRQMPPATKLVQVTGGERPEALTKIARWHGISFDRLNPMDEAETCARLAAKGVGHVASAFEDKTWIKVSRRRSPGRGGWSQKRYTRKIHGSVKSLAREVERELHQSGFQFNSRVVEGIGGYIRSEFVVEAPRHRVHISSGSRGDAQIRVQGVERPRLKFEPLRQKRSYIIAGIDPGTTTGLAALDLNGELVDLQSARAMSSSDVIEWLAERGKPLIVATDVFPAPGAVEKVKRSFNAVLYSPGQNISSEEKIALARGYGYRNDHERDSLAAAVSAYKKYKNTFQQVEKKTPVELNPDEVKALVVKGRSIDQAISELISPPPEEAPPAESVEIVNADLAELREENRRLAEQIRRLKDYQDDIREKLAREEEDKQKLERTIERLKDESLRKVKRDHEIKIREKEIQRLRNLLRLERRKGRRLKSQLKRLRRAEELEEAAVGRQVKEIEAFSGEAVMEAIEQLDIGRKELVLLKDASGGGPHTADILIEKEVEAIIIESEMDSSVRDYFMDHDIPVLSSREVPVKRVSGVALIDPQDLEVAKVKWAEQKRLREAEKKTEWLERIVQEYRAERRKDERQRRRELRERSDSVFKDSV